MIEHTLAQRLDEENPWPGLAAYDEASQRFFYGRTHATAELLRLIRQSPIVTLYGKSGLGKSSMLQAGVFPELRAARFLPVHMRLDYRENAAQPLMTQAAQRVQQEIRAAAADGEPFEPGESLWAYLQRGEYPIWTSDNYPLTPVLVFDQFEEVFSRGGSPAHVKVMLDALADLVGNRLPASLAEDREGTRRLNLQSQQYRVVLSFRSDFLAEVESWERAVNLPRHESLHLTAMSRETAIEAVESAGARVLEPGVAVQIVDFLLQRSGTTASARDAEVEPVLVSLCCYQLNRRRPRPGRIDAALVRTVGEGILKGFFDEALAGMAPRVSLFIEENLILGDRYRNSFPLEEAVRKGALTQDELGQLVERRLLRIDPQGEVPRVELIHDRLVGVVREARDARRAREGQQREREAAERQAREQHERERLAESERERARVARWRNGLASAVVLLLLAAGGAVYFARAASLQAALASSQTELAISQADAAASARNTALAELDKVKESMARLEEASAERDKLIAAGDVGARTAATAKTEAATREFRSTLATAQQQIEATAAGSSASEAVPVAAPVAPTRRAAADETISPAGTLEIRINPWRLSSGGCLKGEVSVAGTARFWIEPAGSDAVIVHEEFEGTGNGFKVVVRSERKPVPKKSGYYDVETRGDWSGPGGRSFRSSGIDRVFTSDGLTPTSAVFVRFRTICSG